MFRLFVVFTLNYFVVSKKKFVLVDSSINEFGGSTKKLPMESVAR